LSFSRVTFEAKLDSDIDVEVIEGKASHSMTVEAAPTRKLSISSLGRPEIQMAYESHLSKVSRLRPSAALACGVYDTNALSITNEAILIFLKPLQPIETMTSESDNPTYSATHEEIRHYELDDEALEIILGDTFTNHPSASTHHAWLDSGKTDIAVVCPAESESSKLPTLQQIPESLSTFSSCSTITAATPDNNDNIRGMIFSINIDCHDQTNLFDVFEMVTHLTVFISP
jgi:hypothetical protein